MFSDSHIFISISVAAGGGHVVLDGIREQQQIPCSKLQELEQVQKYSVCA
jgi:hypothetical protein